MVGVLTVLAAGIAIGSHLFQHQSADHVTTERAAAPTPSAAPEPGRSATHSNAHTRSGAVAAAARSITAFAGDVLLDPVRLHAIVARLASDSSRARLIETFEQASAQVRTKLGADTVPRPVIVLRAVPVGYRVDRYSARHATVALWYVGIVGSGATVQPQESWRTETVSLAWDGGAWKVDAYSSTPGPTPAPAAAEAEAPGELFTRIAGFNRFEHAEP
jgi:hypothetical protein